MLALTWQILSKTWLIIIIYSPISLPLIASWLKNAFDWEVLNIFLIFYNQNNKIFIGILQQIRKIRWLKYQKMYSSSRLFNSERSSLFYFRNILSSDCVSSIKIWNSSSYSTETETSSPSELKSDELLKTVISSYWS